MMSVEITYECSHCQSTDAERFWKDNQGMIRCRECRHEHVYMEMTTTVANTLGDEGYLTIEAPKLETRRRF